MADPKENNNDTWKSAVDMLTGYMLPDRSKVFDNLKGNDDIPLIHVRLDKVSDHYSPHHVSGGGWHVHNTDYVFPFLGEGNRSAGAKVPSYNAYITFLASAQALPPAGDDIISSYKKTSDKLKDKGGYNKEGDKLDWDTGPLTQYVYGSKAALDKLTTWPYSTHGFSDRSNSVADDSYVDLGSFSDVAKAFDRAVKFFTESAVTVGKWDTENIGEGSDSWDGTPAAVFKQLIHKLAKNYDGYADQLKGEGETGSGVLLDGTAVTSRPAIALAELQQTILTQAQNLVDAWNAWRAESNPQRWLYDMLQDARFHSLDTQFGKVKIVNSGERYGATLYNVALEGFDNNLIVGGVSYGQPHLMESWKRLAEEAVRRWDNSAKNWLGVAGANAIVALTKAFDEAEKAFDSKLTDKDKRPISDIVAKETRDKEKKDAEREKAKAKAEADREKAQAEREKAQAKAEAEREKAEAKRERDKEKAEAEQEKAQAKAEQEKKEAEAKRERDNEKAEAEREKAKEKSEAAQEKAEAKAEQAATKEEANKEKAQAKAEQEAAKQKAEQEKNEAKAEQQQEKAQAKAEQQAAKQEAEQEKNQAKAEQQQEKAEAKAGQEAAKQKAEQEKAEAKAQNEQDRNEAKQQAAQQQAFALSQADKQRAEAKKEKDEAKAEQEKEKAEAKAEQQTAKQEAEQEKNQAKAEQDKEKAAAKQQAEQQRAEAQKQQEQARQEAQQEKNEAKQQAEQQKSDAQRQQEQARQDAVKERQQARLEAEQAKADAQADYEQQKAEAREERAAAEQHADRQEAAAKHEYEQQKAEAQSERDQAHEQADQDRAQAKRDFDREVASGGDEQAAREKYDHRIAEINKTEQDALRDAGDREAQAKHDYQEQKAAAQEERQQARADAEQARRDAKAEYDQKMGDIQSEYDRIAGGDKDIEEQIRQRIADLPQPPDLSSYNPSPGAGSEYASAFNDNLYNSDDLASALGRPQGDGALAGSSTGSPGGSGAPMMPQMMRGGGESGSSGERVRNVLDAGAGRSGRVASSGSTVEDEEHRVIPRATQTSSSSQPFMPPMGGMPGSQGPGQQTESSDRERTTWLAEDEDVWGTEESGTPQALGR
ncbi:AAWKG family protein [Streptomyces sp. NPDC002144]